jgi:hypothetical protein
MSEKCTWESIIFGVNRISLPEPDGRILRDLFGRHNLYVAVAAQKGDREATAHFSEKQLSEHRTLPGSIEIDANAARGEYLTHTYGCGKLRNLLIGAPQSSI